ncbi:MAG: peptidylprolyl isomerase [Devosiaceae bacterium]|nr:peptidylprolyl isomerase [Devosiaceae bacterium MH13]
MIVSSFRPAKLLGASALAASLCFGVSAPAAAQETIDQDTVLATVNGYEITELEARLAGQDFAEQMQRVPADQRRAVVVDALIDLHLLAMAADEAGLDESSEFERRMAYQEARTLRTAYLVEIVAAQVDDGAVRAAYDEFVTGFDPVEERRARHILVEDQETAMELIGQLNGGADFAELATEHSTGPSGPSGGDLGWFSRGRMVPAFEEAAFGLEPGSYTNEPVETRFGFHVILVEETRDSEPPAFEAVASDIQQSLLQQRFAEVIGGLRESASIDYQLEGLTPPAAAE